MNLYVVVIAAYSVGLAALGIESLRRTRRASDFLVAGRSLSAGALFVSLLAANIGAGSTVGATGLGYKLGLSAWWWVGSAGIGSIALGLTVGPKMWRLAKEHNFYTVGDFLEHRFGSRLRLLVAASIWLGSLALLAGQLIAVAQILFVVAGLPKPVGCFIGGLLATVYFTAGGLKGTIRINTIQLVVKLAGFFAALAVAWPLIGGRSGLVDRLARAGTNEATYFSFGGGGLRDVLGFVVILVPAFIISPGLLQKIYGAKDETAVRRGVVGNALVLLAYAIVPVTLGMIARAHHPGLPPAQAESALPILMTELLPAWLGAFTLAAVFSAEVGTADAVLFMLSSSLAQDLYRPLLRPDADDRHLLRVSRIAAFGAGLLGIVLAIQLASVIQGLTIFYSLISAVLAIPLLAGLYLRRAREAHVLLASLVSLGVLIGLTVFNQGKGISIFPPVLVGIGAGTLALFLSIAVIAREEEN